MTQVLEKKYLSISKLLNSSVEMYGNLWRKCVLGLQNRKPSPVQSNLLAPHSLTLHLISAFISGFPVEHIKKIE